MSGAGAAGATGGATAASAAAAAHRLTRLLLVAAEADMADSRLVTFKEKSGRRRAVNLLWILNIEEAKGGLTKVRLAVSDSWGRQTIDVDEPFETVLARIEDARRR
ncbi:hypothetical protein [Parvularcula oceani]|uniref:hypothetical protein n=1 Tax=Parvularcula oceani TaxID=1247963 RepID=UPI0004E0EC4C|nr:hypothetical protein [Parvularcula oceani]